MKFLEGKIMKKLISLVIVLTMCIGLCLHAFATDNITDPTSEPINNVKSAKIISVPFKNRIVFGFGSPNSPDGIVLKLIYNDGTEKTETIVQKGVGYFAGDECVFGSARTDEVCFGLQSETLYINDERTSVEYNYYVIPPILSILKTLFERTIWI